MKKILYTNFESADDIITAMLDNKDIKKAVTRSNLYTFWKKIVSPKYKEKSRPWGMGGRGLMIIACENSIVAHELTLCKAMLLTKLEPYMKTLKIKVTDLKFDVKKWEVEKEEEE